MYDRISRPPSTFQWFAGMFFPGNVLGPILERGDIPTVRITFIAAQATRASRSSLSSLSRAALRFRYAVDEL